MQFSATILFLAACSGVFAAPTGTATQHEARIEARQLGLLGAAANVVGGAANVATLGLFGGGFGGYPGGFGGYGGGFGGYGWGW